ncbi:MAG TPA: hypothetical protein DCQ31_06285 [Bacteroidales bacterium]|nr:hypothetical protein [Bacteroidales bacterium]
MQKKLIPATTLLIIGVITVALTLIIVFLSGLANHRTLFVNSLVSTTILSTVFISFLTYGLFNGLKLKNDFGNMGEHLKFRKFPTLTNFSHAHTEAISIESENGFASILLSVILNILIWVVVSILLTVLFWFLGSILWITVVLLFAMLYWIFYRATRFVLKNANVCKNNLLKSFAYAVFYTVLYIGWMYGIILVFKSLK